MKTDNTTRFASLLLIFFFLFNDLHASARAIMHWDQLNNIEPASSSTSLNRAFSRSSAQPDFTNNTKPSIPVNTPESPSSISSLEQFSIKAIEDGARIGLELNMPVNDPKDDIFNFILPEDFKSADWSAIYLNYELKGLKDGRGLAKSFNSKETFGERSLEKDNQWYEVSEKVNPADLQAGRNYLRFTIPNGLGLSAEIKGLKLDFQRRGDNSLQSPRLERVITEDPAYFQAIPAIEGAAAYRLREVEMPALPQGVINVTAGAKAYQPAPQVVAQAHQIGFKLNIGGMNSQRQLSELQVYYFDYNRNAWQGVAIDSIDTQGEIAFVPNKGQTQYFGALIKSPEMPEASAFAPTMIQDIEAANPAAGMNIMQPPGISRTGEAAISYPLQIPAGRKGIQPQLALSYNSDAGSSWVGYGWNIGIPSISVDTKWGVPTFDPEVQTEQYLFNGQALFEEGEKRSNRELYSRDYEATDESRRFYTKVTGSYQKISRYGTDPSNYWWEVVDASGTITRYGHYEHSYGGSFNYDAAVVENYSTVPGEDFDAQWMITEIEDKAGNLVTYEYEKNSSYDALPNTDVRKDGRSWYIKRIYYTGEANTLGKYKVEFNYKEAKRTDARVDLNYGFKKVDDLILKNIKVVFTQSNSSVNELVKYKFNHQTGEAYQYKEMLVSLEEFRNGEAQAFYKHEFDYYSGDLHFGETEVAHETVDVNVFNHSLFGEVGDKILEFVPGVGGDLSRTFNPSPLGSSTTRSHNVPLSFGLGYTPPFWLGSDKNFTLNFKGGGSWSYSQENTKFQDVNGDGLADLIKVEDRGSDAKLYYFPMVHDDSGYKLGARRRINEPGLFYTKSNQYNTGFELLADMEVVKLSYGLNWNFSNGATEKYLMDYNADGIPDLIKPAGSPGKSFVFFGGLDETGNLAFNLHSANTYSPILQSGALPDITVDTNGEPFVGAESVMSWEAPATGVVSISGTSSLTTEASGPVEVAIQKNKAYQLGGFQTVEPGNPVNMSISSLSVTKGDTLYFRVRSGEDSYEDLVQWDPEVQYTSPSQMVNYLDGAGHNYGTSSYSDGFLLSAPEAVSFNATVPFKIDWPSLVITGVSDALEFRVRVSMVDETDTSNNVFKTYVRKIPVTGGSVNPTPSEFLANGSEYLSQLSVSDEFLNTASWTQNQKDTRTVSIEFEVFGTSNLKWQDINWRPEVVLSPEDPCTSQNEDLPVRYPVVHYRTYNKAIELGGAQSLGYLGNGNYRVWPSLPAELEIESALNQTYHRQLSAYFTVKSGGEAIQRAKVVFAKPPSPNPNQDPYSAKVYTVDEGGVKGTQITGAYNNPSLLNFNGTQVVGNEISVEWFSNSALLVDMLENHTTFNVYDLNESIVNAEEVNFSIFSFEPSFVGDHHLQWGQFMWNDLDRETNTPIKPHLVEAPTKELALDPNNNLSSLTANPTLTQMQGVFNSGTVPDVKFMPLIAKRGEDQTLIRSYIQDASSYTITAPQYFDRYIVSSSHSGIYGNDGLIAPWLLVQDDLPIIPVENDPTGTDIAVAVPRTTKSLTLAENYAAGANIKGSYPVNIDMSTSSDKNSSAYFNETKTQMMDINGDGFPDLWVGDQVDIHVSDPRGGMNTSPVSFSSAHKTNSYNDFSASIGTGSAINERKSFLVFDQDQVNLAQILGAFSIGESATYSMGQVHQDVTWSDMNGDGLVDRVEEDQNSTNVLFSKGYSLDNPVQYGFGDFSEVRTSTVNLAFPQALTLVTSVIPDDILEKLVKGIKTKNNSYAVGLGVNRNSSFTEGFYMDINGDGLADRVENTNIALNKYDVYLNTGTDFASVPIELATLPGYFNQSNTLGMNANGSATAGFPLFSSPAGNLKASVNGAYSYSFSAALTRSSFTDLNGDGKVDLVTSDEEGDIKVYHNQLGKALKLKSVKNPLRGEFVLDYKLEGNKFGYYPAEITTHLSPADEDVFWDMPMGKWVLGSLVIKDNYNFEQGGTDLDGADEKHFSFYYDGGVKSRRERDFHGFSRIETRHDSKTFDVSDNNIKPYQDSRIHNDAYCWVNAAGYPYAERYYSEIKFFKALIDDEPVQRKIYEYQKDVLTDHFFFLNYVVHKKLVSSLFGEDPSCNLTGEIYEKDIQQDVISHKENRYNWYQVKTSGQDLGTVDLDDNLDLVTVDFGTIGENSSVFPALENTLTYVHPEIDTTQVFYNLLPNPVSLLQVTKYSADYDRYYNVTQYRQGYGSASNSFTETVLSTTNYTQVHEESAMINISIDTRFNITNPFGYANEIPGLVSNALSYELQGPTGYDPDTLIIPTYYLESSDCGIVPNTEFSFNVPVTFRKEENKSIQVIQRDLTTTINFDLIADMFYYNPNQVEGLTGFLKKHEVRMGSSSNSPVRRTHAIHGDGTTNEKWQIHEIRNELVSQASNNLAITNLFHDSYGQVSRIIGPKNHQNQRMQVDYTYDTYLHQNVESISNSFGESVCNIYSTDGNNLLLQTTGINEHPMRYLYDAKNRVTQIYGPEHLYTAGAAPTISFEYYPRGIDGDNGQLLERKVPVAFTYHNINESQVFNGPGSLNYCNTLVNVSGRPAIDKPLRTATFVDGLSQVMQVKKDVSCSEGGQYYSNIEISGITRTNLYGWPTKERLSFLNSSSAQGSLNDLGEFVIENSPNASMMKYDYLGRVNLTLSPTESSSSGSSMSIDYKWDNTDKLFVHEILGPEDQDMRTYLDAMGRKVRVERGHGTDWEETKFSYDALGQLTSYLSPALASSSYVYDEFGRVVTENHSDRGATTNEYDLAGNLTKVTNAAGEYISMSYNRNRLIGKTYSRTSAVNNQTYVYGSPGDGKNGAGRVVQIEQGTDFKIEEFKYDLQGNLIEEKKVITIPQAGPQEFLTEFNYDPWGRIKWMVYPDGETVNYNYNLTGDLESMTGQRAGFNPHDILKDAQYDGYGNLKSYTYGNQAVTNLTYNVNSRRLTNASVDLTYGLNSGNLLNKNLVYDDQGNIEQISNTAVPLVNTDNNAIGGAYELSSISYDYRGQLSGAFLKYSNTQAGLSGTLQQDIVISSNYYEAGRIRSKSIYDNNTSDYRYDNNYKYLNTNVPHRLTNVAADGLPSGDSKTYNFEYNLMGSISSKRYTEVSQSKTVLDESMEFCWTEDQQLSGVVVKDHITESSHAHHYLYDQSGVRILKTDMYIGMVGINSNQTNSVPVEPSTVYANAYYVATHYDEVVLASKHYYMGSQRIASNLISKAFDHEDPNLEPLPGEEGQNGYASLSTGAWQDLNATMQCLYDDGELSFGGDMLYLQTIGEESILFDDGEGGEYSDPTAIDATTACEQSLYWATIGGVNCTELEVIYFYHPDYLGSVEFVTDMRGKPYQFFLNTPWGENLENQFAKNYTSFSSRFRFNGKEWDEETGNFYYGARYYDPKISVWLSVDPLAHEYPGWSPYNFTMNSPLNLVDPDGMAPGDPTKGLASKAMDWLWTQAKSIVSNSINSFAGALGSMLGEKANEINNDKNPIKVYKNITNPNNTMTEKQSEALANGASNAISYEDFAKSIQGLTHGEAQRQAGETGYGFISNGPDEQFVRDPADPKRIIDMKHFLSAGEVGELAGLGWETVQAIKTEWRSSAFNLQDIYSNALGALFYNSSHYRSYQEGNIEFSQAIQDFFEARAKEYE